MTDRRTKLSDLIAESSKIVNQITELNSKLTDLQAQIEARAQKLLSGKSSSHEMPIVIPDADNTDADRSLPEKHN